MRRPLPLVLVLLALLAVAGCSATEPRTANPSPIAKARMLQAEGRLDEAIALLDAVVAESPARGDAWYELGVVLHAAGRYERAATVDAKAAGFSRFRADALFNLARAHVQLGNHDAALDALEQAMDAGYRETDRLASDAELAPLRADPRFDEVAAGIETRRKARRALGAWAMETEFQGRTIEATMVLQVRRGAVQGTWSSMGRTMDLEDVAADREALRFVRRVGAARLQFDGTVENDDITGVYSGDYGDLACVGVRSEAGYIRRGPLHERPIVERGGRTLLWAKGDTDGDADDVEWFDMTDALVDPAEFQFGIGKDRIPSIDDPVFARPGDPRLAEAKITDETVVIGYASGGVAKAYPIFVLDHHEVVNDEFRGVPFAVCW
jgi:hypothetical protein